MTATKICKICGNEYEYCHTFRRDGIFRWQDVACCVEHGNQYFAEIAASRNETPATEPVKEFVEEVVVVNESEQNPEPTKEDESEIVVEEKSTSYFSSKKKSRK